MIYEKHVGQVLVDREFLATATGRSPHTIRLRCTHVTTHDGLRLYDLEASVALLDTIPVRTRRPLAEPANAV